MAEKLNEPNDFKRFAVATVFRAVRAGKHWWLANRTTYPHRIEIIEAPDVKTATALAVSNAREYWDERLGDALVELEIFSVVSAYA